MSNLRTIFWLFILTAAAVAANLFVPWRTPASRALPSRTLLDPSFSPETVTLARAGSPETVLKREDRWRLVRPYAGPADAQMVLRLLDAISGTPIAETLSGPELVRLGRSPGDFGLTDPSLRLVVSDGKSSVALSFGDATPSSNGVYVAAAESDAVMIVPRAVREAADLPAAAFRDRDIFPYEPDFVLGFDLRKAGEKPVSFTRTGEGWTVGDAAASSARVRSFLARLTNANALDFFWPGETTNEVLAAVSEARLVGYGLDSGAALTVTCRCRDGVDRRISIGNGVGPDRVYALVHNGSAIVSVDASLKTDVLEGTRSFGDTRLFPVEAGSVSSFTLAEGGVSCILARSAEDAWRLDSPVAGPADAAVANAILGRLLALTPADIVAKGVSVSVSTSGVPFVVSPKALLGEYRLEDLRSKEILRVDAALVKRLVSTPGGRKANTPVALVYSRERRAWDVESGAAEGAATDARAIAAAIAALSPLKAERIVTLKASAADLARYGLEKPVHTIAVDQEKDGAVRRNVFIGKETSGGRFATVGSAEAIFVLPKKAVSALTAPLIKN